MKLLNIAAAAVLGFGAANACLSESEIQGEREFRSTGVRSEVQRRSAPEAADATFAIGTGNRFARTTPVGLGVKERELHSILNVKETHSALRALKKAYPRQVKLFTPPFKTFEGRSLPGIVIGDNPRVFIMSGIHARERGGPDNVIYFLADLLAANKAGKGLKYGKATYSAKDVKTALSAGMVILPLTNPDGVIHDQKTSTCWRKNRNTESATTGNGTDVGVDLNRNFDFLWDFEKTFDPRADAPASTDPSSLIFYGTGPASEPETKAIVWTLDRYPDLTWFMDLHSFAGSILYAWGDDDTSTVNPEQNLANPKFDGKRGVTNDTVYKEFMTAKDLKLAEKGNSRMLSGMNKAGKVQYVAEPSVGLYPTSGTSNDYGMARYYGKQNCDASRMIGYTLEFGAGSKSDPTCPFYPNRDEYHDNVRQVGAAFIELAILAAGPAGNPLYPQC